VLEQWDLLEASFHAVYGVDLADVWSVKTWRWFAVRVSGLLAADTPLARHFAPTPTEASHV
jgi:hypothetical protein